jgi:hypothetical protein
MSVQAELQLARVGGVQYDMKIRLPIILASLSLLASIAAAGLGVRSFFRKDKLEYVSEGGRLVMLISKSGRLDVLYNGRWRGEVGFTHIRGSPSGLGLTDYSRRFLGFGSGGRSDGTRFVNIPYWFPALCFAMPAALTARGLWRRRPARPGVCRTCGYDLRASPDRCPECGTAGPALPIPASQPGL